MGKETYIKITCRDGITPEVMYKLTEKMINSLTEIDKSNFTDISLIHDEYEQEPMIEVTMKGV